jgi:hypothetical protein
MTPRFLFRAGLVLLALNLLGIVFVLCLALWELPR